MRTNRSGRRLASTIVVVGVVIGGVAAAAPAGARATSSAPRFQVEDHFRQAVAQWTDCVLPPPAVPEDCTGVAVTAFDARSRVDSSTTHDVTVEVDAFHVHITADHVTVDENPFTTGIGAAVIAASDAHLRAAATVALDDGTVAHVRVAWAATTAEDVDRGDADVARTGCPSGHAHVQYRTFDRGAEVNGVVEVHRHRLAPTSFVDAPFLHGQDDRGSCI